ncbi:hypothetical protein RclHR1_16620001 [Rhizophagus clarus]|uniref:Bromo domain-containing protein n=1 Tax=Rhizophagus clarus TaxID=94130 RepID=A0A2Z6QI12_9GLOM|nr:hypothetical protein RclHR1_16620001 [Rhizophagus clarus]
MDNSTDNSYPGQNFLISYLKKQSTVTYRGFLTSYRNNIITLLSSYPDKTDLDNIWANNFLNEVKKIFMDKEIFKTLNDKLILERVQHKKFFQIYWMQLIKEYNYKNISPNLLYCYDILCELKNKPYSYLFYKYTDNSDYFKYSRDPIDLFTINSRLENNEYSDIDEFENDIRLIFHNCFTNNNEESEIYYLGKALECAFNKKWIENPQIKQKEKLKRNFIDDKNNLSIDFKKQKLDCYTKIANDIALVYNDIIAGNIISFKKILKKTLISRSRMSLLTANEPVLQAIVELLLPLEFRVPELCLIMNNTAKKGHGKFGFVDVFVLGNKTKRNYVCLELKYISLVGLLKNINGKQSKIPSANNLRELDEIIENEDEESLLRRQYTHYVKETNEYKQTTIGEILNNGISQLKKYMNTIAKGKANNSEGLCDERVKVTNSDSNKLIGFIIIAIGFHRIIWKSINEMQINYRYDKIK